MTFYRRDAEATTSTTINTAIDTAINTAMNTTVNTLVATAVERELNTTQQANNRLIETSEALVNNVHHRLR